MPQLFTYLVVTFFGALTWSLWNFRHCSWKKCRTLHLKKSLVEYESPSKLPSTLHSMALMTRTRHPFWMFLIISFSLMRKRDTQVRCPSSQTELDFGPPCDQVQSLWPSLIPCCPSPPSDLVVSFSTSYLCPQLSEQKTHFTRIIFYILKTISIILRGS